MRHRDCKTSTKQSLCLVATAAAEETLKLHWDTREQNLSLALSVFDENSAMSRIQDPRNQVAPWFLWPIKQHLLTWHFPQYLSISKAVVGNSSEFHGTYEQTWASDLRMCDETAENVSEQTDNTRPSPPLGRIDTQTFRFLGILHHDWVRSVVYTSETFLENWEEEKEEAAIKCLRRKLCFVPVTFPWRPLKWLPATVFLKLSRVIL